MKTILHRAKDRGFANHGWLNAAHSFSFANYYNPEKIHFGKLRVLNDDIVAPSTGFDLHPHQDMEIITIPLSGALRHGDNMGNEEIIKSGEVQVMSAGSGVWHSEHNASDSEPVNLFQIWIYTDKKGHKPRYEQKMFSEEGRKNNWQLLVSPDGQKESLWIHQNAYISFFESVTSDKITTNYSLRSPGNGIYFMIVEGNVEINGEQLEKKDALGVWSTEEPVNIFLRGNSKILAIEIPMS